MAICSDNRWCSAFGKRKRGKNGVGATGDNAAMESFFSLQQTPANIVSRRIYALRHGRD